MLATGKAVVIKRMFRCRNQIAPFHQKKKNVANKDAKRETNVPASSSAPLGPVLHSDAYDENENTISSINNDTASVAEIKNNSGASQTMLEQQKDETADDKDETHGR